MSTFDIVVVYGLCGTGVFSIGHGVFQLSKGTAFRKRGLGEILDGIGFYIMGWDLISGPSIVFGFGALVSLIGSAVAYFSKSPNGSG